MKSILSLFLLIAIICFIGEIPYLGICTQLIANAEDDLIYKGRANPTSTTNEGFEFTNKVNNLSDFSYNVLFTPQNFTPKYVKVQYKRQLAFRDTETTYKPYNLRNFDAKSWFKKSTSTRKNPIVEYRFIYENKGKEYITDWYKFDNIFPTPKAKATPTPILVYPQNSGYRVDGHAREVTFANIFKLTGEKYFFPNGDGKIINDEHYGTGTRTGSSQSGGHFFGDFTLPDEIKDNVVAMNKFDLFSDKEFQIPLMAGAVLEVTHLELLNNGSIIPMSGAIKNKMYVIVTDSMFDGGRIQGDIDIFTATYDKLKGRTEGGGNIFVKWKVVDFSNLSKNLKLSYVWKEANNPYYLRFKLLWHKLPVRSIEYKGEKLQREQDNFFVLPNQSIDASKSATIDIEYIDGSKETVVIDGPKDKQAHEIKK